MRKAPQEKRTFFVTSVTHFRDLLFKNKNFAGLQLDVLYENRKLGRFLLHEFVLMPDHFHLILTPAPDKSLERALQYIKGGFSFRVKRELAYKGFPWEEGFPNHRSPRLRRLSKAPGVHSSEPGESEVGENACGIPLLIGVSGV